MKGNFCVGCISDNDPQPILLRSKLGLYAVCTVGIINNAKELTEELIAANAASFETMSSGNINTSSIVGALISQKDTFEEGIRFAQDKISGTVSLLILTSDGIIAARDRKGRLPIIIGRRNDGYCCSFESFAFQKLDYELYRELLPAEIVKITPDGVRTICDGVSDLNICTFLWTYYGYPNSVYEGVTVETMRTRNGEIMAEADIKNGTLPDVDYICGVPDSGVPHAIGYANRSGIPFARPFIKYTPTWPRSFMPQNQSMRNKVAKMKLIPVHELIEGKKLLFVDDSIVRGTQMRETVEFLYANGAKEVHMRSACPPIMYSCKYLSFSSSKSDMDLIARRVVDQLEGEEGVAHLDEYADAATERGACLLKTICEDMGFDSLSYQSLQGMIEAIGIDPEKICTYCWDGRE